MYSTDSNKIKIKDFLILQILMQFIIPINRWLMFIFNLMYFFYCKGNKTILLIFIIIFNLTYFVSNKVAITQINLYKKNVRTSILVEIEN